MKGKIFAMILYILSFVGCITSTTLAVEFGIEKNSMYTEEEVEEITNEKNAEYISQLNAYKIQVEEKDDEISNLNLQITTLTDSCTEKDSQINELNSQISTLNADKSSLECQNTELNSQIETLTSQISSLESEKSTLETEKTDLQSQITDLNSQITTLESDKLTLQNEVTRLQGLLDGYEDIKNGTFEVDFYLKLSAGDTLLQTQVVKYGKTPTSFEVEETDDYVFDYWTTDGTTEIDPFTQSISAITAYYGIVTYKYTVTFIANGETVDTQKVLNGSCATAPNDLSISGYKFTGWSIDGETVVDLSSIAITEDTTFTAVLSKVVLEPTK